MTDLILNDKHTCFKFVFIFADLSYAMRIYEQNNMQFHILFFA